MAVSSPWASEKIVEPLLDLTKRLEAEVVVAHVAQTQEEDEAESDATQRGEQTLQLLRDVLEKEQVVCDTVMLFADDIAKALVKTAAAKDCTLIVIGTGSKGVFQRLFGGDVPGNLARLSEVPVLMLPTSWSGRV